MLRALENSEGVFYRQDNLAWWNSLERKFKRGKKLLGVARVRILNSLLGHFEGRISTHVKVEFVSRA